jgi:hypothetical protein
MVIKVKGKALSGRPPLKIPDEDLDALGHDLLDWLDTVGSNKAFFQDWYFDKHGLTRGDWKSLIQRQGFLPYYEIARLKMTRNLMYGDLDKGYVHRYLGLYDDQLHDHEEGVKDREAGRKKLDSTNLQALAEGFGRMQSFFEQLRSMQTSENMLSLVNHKV